MFLITIQCSSIIHQNSVPKAIIHQVHDPHRLRMVASSNLQRWRCCSTTLGSDIASLMMFSMWKSKPFLCSNKLLTQMGHLNQCLILENLIGLTGPSSSLLPDYWSSSSSSSSFSAASFSAASFSATSFSAASFLTKGTSLSNY
jgi:hypothetical protein